MLESKKLDGKYTVMKNHSKVNKELKISESI